jgi:ABC-2 type transport system ATP-binding protein
MLEFDGVSKRFGTVVALDRLSLAIPTGEFFGLLGPNGAGKTTALRLLTGLTLPDAGSIKVGGRDFWEDPEASKRQMGYVPDKPFVFEKLTGREYLNFTAGLYGLSEKEIAKGRDYYIGLFELLDWADELLESYSHGMRQKIIMTSVFLRHPPVIVLDEPMVGLDPRGAVLVKRVLKELSRSGTTVLMSTHSLEATQELCDRIGIIQRGVLIAVGTMEELQGLARSRHTNLETLFLELTGGDVFQEKVSFLPKEGQ